MNQPNETKGNPPQGCGGDGRDGLHKVYADSNDSTKPRHVKIRSMHDILKDMIINALIEGHWPILFALDDLRERYER